MTTTGWTLREDATERFRDTSPVTGDLLAEVPARSVADALATVERAARAQREWAATPYSERRRILLAAADLLDAELEEHVTSLAVEIGAVRPFAAMNVHEAAETFREAAGLTSRPIGEILPSADPQVVNHSVREPAGVSLSIVPWNAPVILAARSSAISLAVGNAVVVRPSELAPWSAGYLIADVLRRAGLPEHLWSVVSTAPGRGRAAIEAMIDHPLVRRVAFIGSTPVGRSIAARAGAALTPAVLELGGKNATVVRRDADIAAALPQLAFAAFGHSGQICMCTDRIVVHRDRLEELVEGLAGIADGMRVGDPRDPEVQVGPLIDDTAAAHFTELVEDATAHGARVAAGGSADGRFARPTVLTGVPTDARYHFEEGFAPIVGVVPVDGDDEAVQAANAGAYGLIASVISADPDAAYALAGRIRAGAVHVNGPSVGDEPHVPFGGLGESGMGRLGGTESARFFTEQRSFYVHAVDSSSPAAR